MDWGRNKARQRYADGGEVAVKIARGLNSASRATRLPYNKGAVGVQQNADMVESNKISDAVPRKGMDMEPARKRGGKVK